MTIPTGKPGSGPRTDVAAYITMHRAVSVRVVFDPSDPIPVVEVYVTGVDGREHTALTIFGPVECEYEDRSEKP